MRRAVACVWGSSPLARGLLGGACAGGSRRGIIPARAGFTWDEIVDGWHREDHPRSRGVYPPPIQSSSLSEGSSPLARGLPFGRSIASLLRRIIPARAGFTPPTGRPGPSRTDHPRSRGVYNGPDDDGGIDAGSSPLARGLQLPYRQEQRRSRIIPARAGFTLADPWNPNDDLPYQTAFTFTGDLAPAPPSCGSAVVSRRSTTTPSAA